VRSSRRKAHSKNRQNRDLEESKDGARPSTIFNSGSLNCVDLECRDDNQLGQGAAVDHSRWGEGKQTLSNNALQLINSPFIQHQLLFPLLVQRPTLCPHLIGIKQYAVGTYK
jgi:hypothetical protein